ncbi:hypothetical protein V8V75_25675 [Peribacillus frigoritolerans]
MRLFNVGPVAKALNGTDLAWAVGLFLPAAIYYFPMKRKITAEVNTLPVEKLGVR